MHLLAIASLKNRALIALVTIVAAVFGGLALTSLKQELIPSIQFPQIAVITPYTGASPEVVNQSVSAPIEQAIRGIADVESTSATSSSGSSVVSATFEYGTDLAAAENKVSAALSRIGSILPEDVDPQVLNGSIDDFPIIQLAVSGDDASALADRLDQIAVQPLEELDGVRGVTVSGAPGQRVTIVPDQEALARAGVQSSAIRDAIGSSGVLIPAGQVTQDGQTLSVQGGTRLTTVDEIAALPLAGSNGLTTIGEIASVAVTDNPATSISRVNGEPALTLAVTKLPDANTVEVSHLVNDALPEIQAELDGATFTTVFDQAPYIEQSIESLATEGLLGLVFAVIVILIFLLSVRATLVTAISIPASVLITFVGMQFAGYSLNILTLGGLTIAIGRVVDDSIVVIENIKRHLAIDHESRSATVANAVREVAGAVTASTITTVAVFLPISFVGGSVGELFRPFALTVTIALVASLLVSLTIVPVLAYWLLRAPKPHRHAPAAGGEERPSRLQVGYLPVLKATLGRPVVTILIAGLVLVGSGALIPFMKTNFLGDSGQNTLSITEEFEPGTSLEVKDEAAKQAESELQSIDGVETVQVTIGGGGLAAGFGFGGGSNTASYSITTADGADTAALQDEARTRLDALEGAGDFSISESAGLGASSTIDVEIDATTQADLQDATATVLAKMQELAAVAEATSSLAAAQPFIQIAVDREAAAAAGFTEAALAGFVSQAMQPSTVGSITIDEQQLSIYVQAATSPATRDELAALAVPTRTGFVPLDTLASVDITEGPATVTTNNGTRNSTVSVTPASDNLAEANSAVQGGLDELDLPAGVGVSLGGVTADQNEAFSQLGLAMLAAILIVYVVMVATFRSLLQPVLLLVSVPFAATGAILLQVVTGVPLGVASLIGVLMLIGIVVTNAIVLVDLINQYRDRGLKVREAIVEGATRRLRPILMTALATIFALLPMAIGLTGGGGFISQPLALVVIGGLISSTVLTLIVLPVLYLLVEGSRERGRERREQRRLAQTPESWPPPGVPAA